MTITRDKSATFSIAVTLADGVTPQDLTGAVLSYYALIGVNLINKSSPSTGITISSPPTAGIATLLIQPSDTALIPFGGVNSGPCELTMQLSGQDYDLAQGTIIVYSNVSTP